MLSANLLLTSINMYEPTSSILMLSEEVSIHVKAIYMAKTLLVLKSTGLKLCSSNSYICLIYNSVLGMLHRVYSRQVTISVYGDCRVSLLWESHLHLSDSLPLLPVLFWMP